MRVCEAHVGCSPWGKGRARSSNIGCRDTNRGAAPHPPTPPPNTAWKAFGEGQDEKDGENSRLLGPVSQAGPAPSLHL